MSEEFISGMTRGRDPRVEDDLILEVFNEASDPVLTASEVSAELPIGQRAVSDRLNDLAERGLLAKKTVGARSAVWWPTYFKWVRVPPKMAIGGGEQFEIHGGPGQRDARVAAIRAAYERLCEWGEASRKQFLDVVFPEHRAGYEEATAWWNKLIRPNLTEFEDVEAAPPGGKWRIREADASGDSSDR